MTHETVFALAAQALAAPLVEKLRALLRQGEDQLIARLIGFLRQSPTPAGTFRIEREWDTLTREGNRHVWEWLWNELDPEVEAAVSPRIEDHGEEYRRRESRTRHQHVATLFGTITLWRDAYRPCVTDGACLFPLEEQLGLVAGCTPALAERAAFLGGRAGATPREVLQTLRRDHHVILGAERLRTVWQQTAEFMEPARRPAQAQRVCEWLQTASAQSGIKPALVVGRDGITVANQTKSSYEVASCGTISVYAGKQRLGTVYLGVAPESGQGTLTDELLALIGEILTQWNTLSQTIPQLSYVSDCGELEESFYTKRLCRMRHPVTKARLTWQRVVDDYHAAQRLTTIAEALVLEEASAKAWSRKMRSVLQEPHGVSRV